MAVLHIHRMGAVRNVLLILVSDIGTLNAQSMTFAR